MYPRASQILNRLSSTPRHHIVAALLAILAIPILLFLTSELIEWWQIAGTLEPQDRIQAKNEALRTAAQVLGGTFFLITAYFTWRSVTTAENNLLTSQEAQITDRFTKAIEQLGNKKLEVRLGGIYALERIAKDSAKDHWTIMEVLTAYIRENAPRKEQDDEEKKSPPTDIQAILTALGRRIATLEREGHNKLDLQQTNLQRASLEGAFLFKTKLQEANLFEANLQDAILSGADLREANLEGAFLFKTKLQEANLFEANLQDAILSGADLTGATLKGATLKGADLREVNLAGVIFNNVRYNKYTQWPEGFTPPTNAINTDEQPDS